MKKILTVIFSFSGLLLFAQDPTTSKTSAGDVIHNTLGLDVQPHFPGSFQSEVGKHMIFPDLEQDIDARLYMSFVIEKDGSLSNIKCERDPGYGLCQISEKALKSVTTKWIPGTENGMAVRVKYTLPIVVRLKADKSKKKD